jgi:hypothetical protein
MCLVPFGPISCIQNPTLWHGPATQPLAVGDVTGSGATPRLEAPQALTWLMAFSPAQAPRCRPWLPS